MMANFHPIQISVLKATWFCEGINVIAKCDSVNIVRFINYTLYLVIENMY